MQENTEASNKAFDFSQSTYEVELDVSTNPAKQKIVEFRLNKPKFNDLVIRERETSTEFLEVTPTDDELKIRDQKANARLFDKIVSHVKGYRLAVEAVEVVREFREATAELVKALYFEVKSAAIRGLYTSTARVRDDDEEGVVLGGEARTIVDFLVGDEADPQFVVEIEFREPEEDERLKFMDKSSQLLQAKGTKKSRSKLVGNLKEVVRFFDEHVEAIRGGVVNGKTFEDSQRGEFLSEIDAIYKRVIVSAFMGKYNAKVQD